MKTVAAAGLLVLLALASPGQAVDPIQKVLGMLADLETKIVGEGEVAQKEFQEYSEWCEDRSKNVDYEIKTGKAQVEDLQATIESETANSASSSAEIEELAASISTDDADLAAATQIRATEASDFAAEEKDLVETINMLERAVAILEREMKKHGASMLQLQNAKSIADAMSVLVAAEAFSSADASRLTALVQSSESGESDELGAPDAAAYEGHSGDIVSTLEGLLDKAQGQLDGSRKKEASALHNFEMLQQSLQDEIKYATKSMNSAKQNLAKSGENKATATGDLSVTKKDLEEDINTLSTLHADCMEASQDFEASTKSRGEELKALATAKKVIVEATSGAQSQTYGLNQVSLLQVVSSSQISSGADLANFEAVRFVRDLARRQNDPMLAQLASRMATAIRFGSKAGESDPFAKVKALIMDMIEHLSKDAQADASHKGYCDKELSETSTKKEDKNAEISKLSTKIDKMTARSAQLKSETAALQKELSQIASSQMEMDKLRGEESTAFATNSAEMQQGLEGIKVALKVLREYYAQSGTSGGDGSAGGIVSLLEVVESDFSRGLAEMTSTEEAAKAEYGKMTQMNTMNKAMKDQDVKYKSKESAGLDKAVAEANSDRSGVQAELDAVLEYLGKLNDMCVAKAEPYAERKARREAEIDGLKQALEILEGEAVLLQRSSSLRGVHRHA